LSAISIAVLHERDGGRAEAGDEQDRPGGSAGGRQAARQRDDEHGQRDAGQALDEGGLEQRGGAVVGIEALDRRVGGIRARHRRRGGQADEPGGDVGDAGGGQRAPAAHAGQRRDRGGAHVRSPP
jgi:hypothetical protein